MDFIAEIIKGWGYHIRTIQTDYVIVREDQSSRTHMVEVVDGMFYVDRSRTKILFEVPLSDPDSLVKLRERLYWYG